MQNKIYLLGVFFMLLPFFLQAQTTGEVTYEVKIGHQEKEEEGIVARAQKQARRGASDLSFILAYNKNEAKFYLKDDLQNKNKDATIAAAVAEYFNPVYTNLKEKKYYFHSPKNPYDKNGKYFIENEMFEDWELKNETKKIEGFTCNKAVGNMDIEEGDKTIHKELIAWYCPEVPVSIGPLGYGGLPGLILELQVDEVLYGAKKLSLDKEVNIEFPIKGEKITEKEYLKKKLSERP